MRRGVICMGLVAVVLATPASASALTLGSLDPQNTDPGPGGYCVASQGNFIQGSIAPGSPSYTVPQGGGTLSSWSTRWGNLGAGVALEVWRSDPTTSGTYILISKDSESIAPDANGVSTFPVSISVQAGDVIGIAWPTANTIDCSHGSPADADTVWGHNGATYTPGSSADFESFIVTRDFLNLQATLQQTADLAVIQTPSRSSVVAGNAVNFVLGATNSGPAPVIATLTDVLPAGLRFFSAAANGGVCSGGQTVVCQVPLGVGGTQTVSIVAVASSPGRQANIAAISGSALDPTAGDNTCAAVHSASAVGAAAF